MGLVVVIMPREVADIFIYITAVQLPVLCGLSCDTSEKVILTYDIGCYDGSAVIEV